MPENPARTTPHGSLYGPLRQTRDELRERARRDLEVMAEKHEVCNRNECFGPEVKELAQIVLDLLDEAEATNG